MQNILAVFLGGAFGAVGRYLLSMYVTRATQGGVVFPFGTLSVNLLGALLAGILWGIGSETIIKPEMRLLLMTGFLGGFTTFSAFAVETYGLISDGEWKEAFINMLANTVGTVLLVAAGVIAVKFIFNIMRGGA